MINIFSYICIAIGVFFWFWGTAHLLDKRSVLYKLHGLSVADTWVHGDYFRATFESSPKLAFIIIGNNFLSNLEHHVRLRFSLYF